MTIFDSHETARQLEQDHPRWIVIFGTFTQEFVCFPRFTVPAGFRVVAGYPEVAADRMLRMERLYRVREGLLSKWKAEEKAGKDVTAALKG